MKATIERTNSTLILNGEPAQVWSGMTERGIPIVFLVTEHTGAFDAFDELEIDKRPPASSVGHVFSGRTVPLIRRVR